MLLDSDGDGFISVDKELQKIDVDRLDEANYNILAPLFIEME